MLVDAMQILAGREADISCESLLHLVKESGNLPRSGTAADKLDEGASPPTSDLF